MTSSVPPGWGRAPDGAAIPPSRWRRLLDLEARADAPAGEPAGAQDIAGALLRGTLGIAEHGMAVPEARRGAVVQGATMTVHRAPTDARARVCRTCAHGIPSRNEQRSRPNWYECGRHPRPDVSPFDAVGSCALWLSREAEGPPAPARRPVNVNIFYAPTDPAMDVVRGLHLAERMRAINLLLHPGDPARAWRFPWLSAVADTCGLQFDALNQHYVLGEGVCIEATRGGNTVANYVTDAALIRATTPENLLARVLRDLDEALRACEERNAVPNAPPPPAPRRMLFGEPVPQEGEPECSRCAHGVPSTWPDPARYYEWWCEVRGEREMRPGGELGTRDVAYSGGCPHWLPRCAEGPQPPPTAR